MSTERWGSEQPESHHGRDVDVVTGVQLLGIESDGTVVSADVFGGEDPVIVDEVAFAIDDPVERTRTLQTLKRWRDESTLLTFLHNEDGSVTLLDEE
jgi:hypothetical protein